MLVFSYLFLLLILLTPSQLKEKNSVPPVKTKDKQNDGNYLDPRIGLPNIPSSIGSQIFSKSPSINSESNRKYSHPDYRINSKDEDRNIYCQLNQPDVECSELDGDCVDCNFDVIKNTCIYGKNVTVICRPKDAVVCQGIREFNKEIICQYCYQTPLWEQKCSGVGSCNSAGAPRNYFTANCSVISEVLCIGYRRFNRRIPCNWKNGYRWSTTFFLSITLGGFGADRFYLGRWQEGIGKLFSFGGLGLWTFIDIILIGVRYLGPADGSVYVD